MMLLTGAADEFRGLELGSYEEYINEKYAQEKNFHLVLAIAELVDRSRGDEVGIFIYDSLGSHPAVFNRTQMPVENNGWARC